MEFANLVVFKKVVKDYNIRLGREIRWVKNNRNMCRAVCRDGCPWEIYCGLNNRTNSYQIKKFVDAHTCNKTFKNKQASSKCVAETLVDTIRSQPNLDGLGAYEHMKQTYNVLIGDAKVYKAVKEARKVVEGSKIEQYGKLCDYTSALLKTNPGSTIQLGVERSTINVCQLLRNSTYVWKYVLGGSRLNVGL